MKKILSVLFVAALLGGCAAYKQVASVNNRYLEDVDTTKQLTTMPFSHSWVWRAINRRDYTGIYIPPMRTDTVDADAWSESMSPVITSREDYTEECNGIAKYFREQLISEFTNYPDTKIKVATEAGPGVAVLNIALTEMVFSHPGAQAGALVSPVPGTGALLSAVADPHAAFAIRITDGATGNLIATVADRKFPPIRIIDLNKFTVTSPIREICTNWSKEIADAVNKGRFAKVESRGRWDWMPW